ncbi:MAG: trypsin-like peptidase domain-containing protein, partial [Actinomycetota bacterium]
MTGESQSDDELPTNDADDVRPATPGGDDGGPDEHEPTDDTVIEPVNADTGPPTDDSVTEPINADTGPPTDDSVIEPVSADTGPPTVIDPIDQITAELQALGLDDDDDDADDAEWLGLPLPMEDRLWRHPSEARYDTPAVATTGSTRGGWLTLVGVAVGAGLLGALVSAVALRSLDGEPETVVERRIEALAVPTAFSGADVVEIAERVSPGVARIAVRRSGDERASGSGVVFRSDGLVLTNAHVVRDAVELRVTLADGTEHDGSVVGIDSLTDIAVVDLDGESLPTVALAT